MIIDALATFAVAVATHLAICRRCVPRRFVAYSLAHGAGFAAGFGAISARLDGIVVAYLFLSFWVLFVVFFINLRNSVSLRLIENMGTSASGVRAGALRASYSPDALVAGRIQLLMDHGYVTAETSGLQLTHKGRWLGWALNVMRKTLGVAHRG